jgi:hypothetical protein
MWYRKGTVQATNSSPVITGTTTEFVSGVRIGDGIVIDGKVYEITNVASNTLINVTPAFEGTSGSNKKYAVIPVLGYDKDLSDAFNRIRLEFESHLSILQDLEMGQFAAPDIMLTAGAALNIGDFVDIVDGLVVPASADTCGFVKKSVAIGEIAEVFSLGSAHTYLGGLTPNALYWLSTSGTVTNVPPTSGKSKCLGRAVSSTTLMTRSEPLVEIKV